MIETQVLLHVETFPLQLYVKAEQPIVHESAVLEALQRGYVVAKLSDLLMHDRTQKAPLQAVVRCSATAAS